MCYIGTFGDLLRAVMGIFGPSVYPKIRYYKHMRKVRGLEQLHILETCWILRQGLESAALPALLLDMAIRGKIQIRETKAGFIIDVPERERLSELDRLALAHLPGHSGAYQLQPGSSGLAGMSLVIEDGLQQKGHVKRSGWLLRKHLQTEQLLARARWGALGLATAALLFAAQAGQNVWLQTAAIVLSITIPLLLLLAASVWFDWQFRQALARPFTMLGDQTRHQVGDLRTLQQNVRHIDAVLLVTDTASRRNAYEWLMPYTVLFGCHSKWIARLTDLYDEYPSWYKPAEDASYDAADLASSLGKFVAAARVAATEPAALPVGLQGT